MGTATLITQVIDKNDNAPQLVVDPVDMCLSDSPITAITRSMGHSHLNCRMILMGNGGSTPHMVKGVNMILFHSIKLIPRSFLKGYSTGSNEGSHCARWCAY